MSLKGKFSREFSGRIRDRGFAYFRSNKVEIVEHSGSHVDARVKGSKIYLVRLTLGRVSLDVACTCPYFEGGEDCKHIWATMLAADSKNYLANASLRTRLNLHLDSDAVDDLLDLDDDQNAGVANPPYSQATRFRSIPSPKINGPSAPGVGKTTNEPEPAWRRQLSLNRNLYLSSKNLPRAVMTLVGRGWRVEAEGKLYRNPGASSVSVSSGIDWFELHGSVDFGDGLEAKLPALLTALQRGESMIALGDGSFGLMPEEWLRKFGLLASLGVASGDHLRFKQTQTGVLDALVAARPEITCDETFKRVREEWQNFKGIGSITEPRGFAGTLRDYQREGLGWFEFLQRFGFRWLSGRRHGVGKDGSGFGTTRVAPQRRSEREWRAGGDEEARS